MSFEGYLQWGGDIAQEAVFDKFAHRAQTLLRKFEREMTVAYATQDGREHALYAIADELYRTWEGRREPGSLRLGSIQVSRSDGQDEKSEQERCYEALCRYAKTYRGACHTPGGV